MTPSVGPEAPDTSSSAARRPDTPSTPDTAAVRAFLDPRHRAWAERVGELADAELRPRPEPAGDDHARAAGIDLARRGVAEIADQRIE